MTKWPSFHSVLLLMTAVPFFLLTVAYVVLLPPPPGPHTLYLDTPVALPSQEDPR